MMTFEEEYEKRRTTSCVIHNHRSDVDFDLREALIPFLPENALDEVVAILQKYLIHLKIEYICYR